MHRRPLSALSAAVLLASALTIAAPAGAVVGTDDAAAQQITVKRPDKRGDVLVERSARGTLSARTVASADLTRVGYAIDRVQQQLTITYAVRHRAPSQRFRQYVVSIVQTDPRAADAAAVVIMSWPGSTAVRIITSADASASHRCAGGSSVRSHHGRVLTQVVPFSCLGDVGHGHLRSFLGLERRNGADVASDATKRTRDLPLTAYVDPTA